MWNCQCEEYGQISNSEFQKGCETLGVKDFSDFKKQVPKKLRATLAWINTPSSFRPFYKFVFTYHRSEGKNVEVATCDSLMKLIFSDKYPLLKKFFTFLNEKGVTHLTLDQWDSTYDLLRVNPSNLDNYDMMAAWPSLMDDFYEWYQKNK